MNLVFGIKYYYYYKSCVWNRYFKNFLFIADKKKLTALAKPQPITFLFIYVNLLLMLETISPFEILSFMFPSSFPKEIDLKNNVQIQNHLFN